MRKILSIVLFSICLLGMGVLPVHAQQGSGGNNVTRDPIFEQDIYDRLGKINPAAVPIFKSSTEAMDRDDLDTARQGFEEVLRLAPNFPDALRRLSYIFRDQGDLPRAEGLARKALETLNTPENQIGLANILLDQNTPRSNTEALRLSKQAVEQRPNDPGYQVTLLFAASALNDVETTRQASADLLRLDSNSPLGHFFNGLIAATDGKWEYAEAEVLLSRGLGVPADMVQNALDEGITTQARFQRLIRYGLYGLAGWVITLGVLFLAGQGLSQLTLLAVNRQQVLTSAEIQPKERLMRRVYRVVIAITGAYFYLSIPILVVLVIVVIGLVLYGFLSIGHIPIRLALIILLAGLYTLYAVVRSLLVRRNQSDPGNELKRTDAFYLWQILVDVARQVNTRPVDRVFVTPGTGIGVYERGGWLSRIRGSGERCLILGLGALPGMNQGQFCAIIAHEYGHFSHADTAGGDLANSVSFHIQNIAAGLVSVGTATWFNPVWLFINGYYRIFLRVTRGASRLQEIEADRYAVMKYGMENMKTGLEHIIHQELMFSGQVKREIQAAKTECRALNNLYTLPPLEDNQDLETAYHKIMTDRTSAYDSHPAPCDRLEYIARIKHTGFDQLDPRPVWGLLSTFTSLQEEMTGLVTSSLRAQGAYWPITALTTEE